ncbi:hypothetical protein D1AOALGA4SA_12427 [Olavius algarvensis Delta 1 endosymbiont]|nr:hypothetical protein D1AOALGA4SA_12427 [Olavius algarvensis Delta 1 endosymbiont]
MSTFLNATDKVPVKNGLRVWTAILILALTLAWVTTATAASMPNACSVDGCDVKIVGVTKAGGELEITFESNFMPDVSKNHFHVWWGENFTVEQVSRNAQTVHGVEQGRWHRHADYPSYVTQGAASTSVRGQATTICVSAADRNHNILDVKVYDCVDVSDKL